ncbi:MAG: Ig-like domain repeat protein [Armatimonadetes bacterium]|nr:Ig-like domain repeat protein [Armatimonadota bacterium]
MLSIAGLGLACAAPAALAGGGLPTADAVRAAKTAASVRFEANVGQTDPAVRYVARGAQYGLFLKPSQMTLALRGGRTPEQRLAGRLPGGDPFAGGKTSVLQMDLAGASRTARALPMGKALFTTRYLRASGSLSAPTFGAVGFQGVYPGIDLAYYGKGNSVEHDFVVKPGANPSRIAMDFSGANSVTVRNGALVLMSDAGAVRWERPVAYQLVNGHRVGVPATYQVARTAKGAARVSFKVARYDTGRALVIDPILTFSTYLGGSADEDDAWGVAVSPAGYVAVVGQTWSANFPAPSYTLSGSTDAFVTVLNSTGTAVHGSVLIGGSGDDTAFGAAADASGNLYVGGATSSPDFPVSPGAAQTAFGGVVDGFVLKISALGVPVYSTYVGGSDVDIVNSVAVNAAGQAAFGGQSGSHDLPVVAALQPYQGGYDAFVGQVNAAGSAFGWLTFYAGYGTDAISAVAYDATGNVCFAGGTDSTGFPATANSFGSTVKGGVDAFAGKINGAGTAVIYGGRTGGSGDDYAMGLAVEASGALFVTGYTTSANFPLVSGAPISVAPANYNGFLFRTNSPGTAITGSTYLGGNGYDVAYGVVLVNGAPVVVGSTQSTNFPVTAGAFQSTLSGAGDLFVSALGSDIKSLTYSTYLGGSGAEVASAITSAGSVVYLVGGTASRNYPVTSGVVQPAYAGNWDGIVTAINFTAGTNIVVNSVTGGVGDAITHLATLKTSGGVAIAGRTLTFKVDGTGIGTSAPTNASGMGILNWTVTAFTVGAHAITADFAGDAVYAASTGAGTLTVSAGSNTKSVVPNLSCARGASATVSGTLYKSTGTVPLASRTITFIVNGVNLGTSLTNASGVATKTFTVPAGWTPGGSSIQFKFTGDASYNSSTGFGTFTTL